MKVVLKFHFPFAASGEFKLGFPTGGRILKVGLDNENKPSVWVMGIAPSEQLTHVTFFVVQTGNEMPAGCNYYHGTFTYELGTYHVFSKDGTNAK